MRLTEAEYERQLEAAEEYNEKLEQLAGQCFHVFCDEYQAGGQDAIELASELIVEDDEYRKEMEAVMQAMYAGNSQQHRVFEGVIERAVRRLIDSFETLDQYDEFIRALR